MDKEEINELAEDFLEFESEEKRPKASDLAEIESELEKRYATKRKNQPRYIARQKERCPEGWPKNWYKGEYHEELPWIPLTKIKNRS